MVSAIFHLATLLLTFSVLPISGEADVFQLPFNIASRMAGEWGIEIHSPCEPYFVASKLSMENTTNIVNMNIDSLLYSLKVEGANVETEVLDAVGLRPLMGHPKKLDSLSYMLCESQTNNFSTPNRPKFGKSMDTTQLSEYQGVIISSESEGSNACDSDSRDVIIRVMGKTVDIHKDEAWKVKESLQFIEVHLGTRRLTEKCVDAGEDVSRVKQGVTPGKRRRRHSGAAVSGMAGTLGGVTDQVAREGSIVIRLARLSPPAKSFYERYFPTLIFSGMMIFYRLVYGFTSYRTLKKG